MLFYSIEEVVFLKPTCSVDFYADKVIVCQGGSVLVLFSPGTIFFHPSETRFFAIEDAGKFH